jgi:hypothetical protein
LERKIVVAKSQDAVSHHREEKGVVVVVDIHRSKVRVVVVVVVLLDSRGQANQPAKQDRRHTTERKHQQPET